VLMVLEAMKMETTITSPVAGKVTKVNAATGDPVQGGQVLVEFE
jgi:methylmalonyl-CoA carboxyltransferase small subunit